MSRVIVRQSTYDYDRLKPTVFEIFDALGGAGRGPWGGPFRLQMERGRPGGPPRLPFPDMPGRPQCAIAVVSAGIAVVSIGISVAGASVAGASVAGASAAC